MQVLENLNIGRNDTIKPKMIEPLINGMLSQLESHATTIAHLGSRAERDAVILEGLKQQMRHKAPIDDVSSLTDKCGAALQAAMDAQKMISEGAQELVSMRGRVEAVESRVDSLGKHLEMSLQLEGSIHKMEKQCLERFDRMQGRMEGDVQEVTVAFSSQMEQMRQSMDGIDAKYGTVSELQREVNKSRSETEEMAHKVTHLGDSLASQLRSVSLLEAQLQVVLHSLATVEQLPPPSPLDCSCKQLLKPLQEQMECSIASVRAIDEKIIRTESILTKVQQQQQRQKQTEDDSTEHQRQQARNQKQQQQYLEQKLQQLQSELKQMATALSGVESSTHSLENGIQQKTDEVTSDELRQELQELQLSFFEWQQQQQQQRSSACLSCSNVSPFQLKGMKGNQKVVSRISLVRPSTSEGSHQRAPHTQQLGLKPRATSASASTTQRSIKSLSQNHTLHSAKFMDPYNKLQTPFIPLCNQVKSRLPDPLSNAWVASPMPTSPN